MNDTATVISKTTGCTFARAQKAVGELIARGWTPPSADCSRSDSDAAPAAPLSGFSAIKPGDVLVAHTDGACSGNPGPGGWAVVFSQNGEVAAEYSGGEANTTSNRMELTAVREAIRHAPPGIRLEIITDSKNVIGWLSQNWKRNDATIAALCAEIDKLRADRGFAGDDRAGGISFTYVRGHQGDKFNERADKLANEAIGALRS